MAELTPEQKFERWVERPLEVLKTAVPNGDGAFAALAISLGLYERLIDSVIHSQGKKESDFGDIASHDLGCPKESFDRFWACYRHGMLHAFQPKNYVSKGVNWGWDIASAAGYEAYPKIESPKEGQMVIKIDPWKFSEHVVTTWKKHFHLMDELAKNALGNISSVPESERHPNADTVDWSQFKTYSERPGEPPSK